MEPDEDFGHPTTEYTERPTYSPRPTTAMEFFHRLFRSGKQNPNCYTRMTPIIYLFVFLGLFVAFCALCYGIGEFFVQLVLPKTEYVEYTDAPTTFFYGVFVVFLLFAMGSSFSMLSVFIRVNVMGLGLRTVPQ